MPPNLQYTHARPVPACIPGSLFTFYIPKLNIAWNTVHNTCQQQQQMQQHASQLVAAEACLAILNASERSIVQSTTFTFVARASKAANFAGLVSAALAAKVAQLLGELERHGHGFLPQHCAASSVGHLAIRWR